MLNRRAPQPAERRPSSASAQRTSAMRCVGLLLDGVRARSVFAALLLVALHAPAVAQRSSTVVGCSDDNAGLAALGLPLTCADMARLSQGLAVANHRPGLCSTLASYELLGLCCAACTAIDECGSSPCMNGAACVDAVAAYTCECAEGWTGAICDEVFVLPDECLEGTFLVSAANATSSCDAPRCRSINDGTAYCYECSVCGEGFTHVADCVLERNNSRDGSDTVCVPTLCDPFPDISSLPHASSTCVTGTIYPYPTSCTVTCDSGWTASSGISESAYACQADGSWVTSRAVVCNDRCEDIPGWTDKDGYSCSTYAALQWCCAPNSPHCNAAYANTLGQDSDDACCATCSAPCVDDDALMEQSYGYDCATVLAKDECAMLRDAGIERSCGCTCRQAEENLHAPTFPLVQGTCTMNDGSFTMRDSAPVPLSAVQGSAHVFCADTTQRTWAVTGVCEALGAGLVYCNGACAARHTCSSCFSASLRDVTSEARCLRDSTQYTWAVTGVCEALGVGLVYCNGACAARHTCSSCFSASLRDVASEARCLRDSEHARAYRFRDVAGSPDMLEFTAEQLGLPQRCSQRWDGRTECLWGFGVSDFTITLWFRATEWFGAGIENPDVTWSNLFAKAQLGMTQPGIIASIYKDDRIVFRLQELPAYSLDVSCAACVSSREWVFLSFVRYDGMLKVLQNGLVLGSKSVPTFDTDNLGTLRLGANHVFSTGLNLDAWIDDFRIYDFALSDSGVRHLYGKTLSLDCFDNYPPLHSVSGTCVELQRSDQCCNATGYLQNGQSCVFECAPGFAARGTQPRCALGHTLTSLTCEPTTREACMDTRATNFDPSANQDDGSCMYSCESLAEQLGLNATATQCDLIQTIDPSDWDAALFSVGSDDSVILQGLSSQSQRNGRIEAAHGQLVVRHISVSNQANSFGGVIESRGASVSVEHCSFVANRADVNVQAEFAGSGGAIYAHAGGELTVHASQFTSNTAEIQGGAIMLDSSVQCILTQAVFKNNVAYQGGGAIWTVRGNMYIEGCAFEGNVARNARRRALQDTPLSQMQVSLGKGGAIFALETPLTITTTTFALNHAIDSGGAVWAKSTTCILTDSILDRNSAVQMGGGLYATDTFLNVDRVDLGNNDAAHGGALYLHTLKQGWKVFNTIIHPFSQERSVSTALTPLSGCAEHPCEPGNSCVFTNFSLFCLPCEPTFMSSTGITCELCGPGKTATADGTDCEACPTLAFSRYGLCESCQRGKEVKADGTGCRPCAYGLYSNDGLECKKCDPGWRPNDDVSATECTRCPPGTFSFDGVSCEFCGFGFSPLMNQTACERLPNCLLPENGGAGSYSLDGGVTCMSCPPGSGPNATQTGCESCDDGLIYDRSGFFRAGGPCTSCPAGTRPVGTPLTACSSCSLDGKASFSPDGLACTDCHIGSQPSELRDACVPCTANDLWFLGECRQCPSGNEPNVDHTVCIPCAPGFAGVSGECLQCPNGTEPNEINSTCVPCRAGYAGVLGLCTRCFPAFQPNDARTACDRCNPDEGYYSPAGVSCLKCAAGYFVNATRTGCDACPYGQYGTNGINCTTCAAGEKVASPVASTGCAPCVLVGLGYYSSDGVQCELCEDGKQPDEARATCHLCPAQMAGQLGTCSVCQFGQPNFDHTFCEDCPAGDISVDGGCTTCADGKEPGHSGEPVCWPCGAGFAGKAGTCSRCQEANEPSLNAFCTNPAVDTQPGCSVSGVCYDLENISTSLVHTRQACLELGACCIQGHAGQGCVSYLGQHECRAGSAGPFQFQEIVTMAYDTYGLLYDSPAYPFRALRQQVRSAYDPCTCDADGIIDGVDTGRRGCAVHADGLPAFCMVPLECNELSGVSTSFPSTGYRWCNLGDPGGDGGGPVLQWTAFSWTPFNVWNESVTVTNASMVSDDRESNRDLETFGDAMAAMNGGDSMIRYRTKISPGYTLDLDLLVPSVVEGVSILVHADQGTVATGYSGISISVSNDSGTTYIPVYHSEAMYGSYERSATYMNMAPSFAFDRWSSHPFVDGPQEAVTNVSIHFSRTDQAGDSAFSLHSLRVDGPGSPGDIRCSNPIYFTYEGCRAASGVCSHGTFRSMHECESHGTCCVEKGCVSKTEQSIELDKPVQLVKAYLAGGERIFTDVAQTVGNDIVPMLESECLGDNWNWTPFVWKPDVWNEARSACQPCTPDTYSTGVRCQRCDAGFQVNDDRTLCVACPAGWYSSASNDAWQLNLQKRVSMNVFRREALNTESDTFEFAFLQPFDMSRGMVIRMTASSIPDIAVAVDMVDVAGRQTSLQVTRHFRATFTTADFAFAGVGSCTNPRGRFVNASDKLTCEIAQTGNLWHPFIPARCSTPLGASAHWNPTDRGSCEIMRTGFTWQPLIPQACRDRRGVVVQARAHQSRAGCELAEHATGYVWSDAVPERCTDAGGQVLQNVTIITHDLDGQKKTVTFDVSNQESCNNAVRNVFGNGTNSTGASLLDPFTRYNFELDCETICEIGRSARIWDYGEGFCTTPIRTRTEDVNRLACEGTPASRTGNTWNVIAAEGCKFEVGRFPVLEGYQDVWSCEMFYTGNEWKNYEPKFCADANLVHIEPVPPDEEACEVGTHPTGYTWTDQVNQGCKDSTGAYTGIGTDQFTCEKFYTGYYWHDSVPAFCGNSRGSAVNFLVDGLGNHIPTSSEHCETVATGNTWNLDTARIQRLVFTAAPTANDWEGLMTVLALRQRDTGIDLLPLGTWLPDDKVDFSPADELSGIVCERCLPGLEPNARSQATGCQRCNTRGEGFYSPDGIACIQCPSGRRPASLTSGFIDGHKQVFDDAQCEPCPTRFAGRLGLCRQCPSGNEPSVDHTVCIPCAPGFAGVSGECSQCPNGTEPNEINSTCIPCRAGYAGVLGLCTRCFPAFQPNDARTACDRCQHQAEPGTPNCVDDDSFVNQYGDGCASYKRGVMTAGQENHARCVEDGADLRCQVSCETCPAVKYSTDGVACTRCDPGYTVNANQTGCEECPYGQFGTDGATCAFCEDGSEVATFRAATRCKSCKLRDVGYYSSGGAFCAVCPEGKQPDQERTRCEPCPTGSLRLGTLQDIASRVCEYCADGQTTTPQSNTACMYCLAGMAGLNGQCDACPAGKHPNPARTACIRCPDGTHSQNGRECLPCPEGLHPDAEQSRCEQCPAGFVEQSNECVRCEASKQPALDHVSCQQCDLEGIGIDGQCFKCDKQGRSLLTGELLTQIPNINSTYLWETASTYGRTSDVGGTCISPAGVPLWQFRDQQECENARVPSNYVWVDDVKGFCTTSNGQAIAEFSDQLSCVSTNNVWTSPVLGYCRDGNDQRVAHPRVTCESSTVVANNVWHPAANTACEDRVPVYCRQHSISLANAEISELEHQLNENSVINQLWREVPGFVLIAAGIVAAYACCRCAEAEAKYRSRNSNAERRPKVKDLASPPVTPPTRKGILLSIVGSKGTGTAGQKYMLDDLPDKQARKNREKDEKKAAEAKAKDERKAIEAKIKAEKKAAKAAAKAAEKAETSARKVGNAEALALEDKPEDADAENATETQEIQASDSGARTGTDSSEADDASNDGKSVHTLEDAPAKDSEPDSDGSDKQPDSDSESDSAPEPEPEPVLFSWEQGFTGRAEPDIADVVASLNRPMLFR